MYSWSTTVEITDTLCFWHVYCICRTIRRLYIAFIARRQCTQDSVLSVIRSVKDPCADLKQTEFRTHIERRSVMSGSLFETDFTADRIFPDSKMIFEAVERGAEIAVPHR